MSEKFTDPLEELMARHMQADSTESAKTESKDEAIDVDFEELYKDSDDDEKAVDIMEEMYDEPTGEFDDDGIDYGDNDLDEEIKEAEKAEEEERERKAEQLKELQEERAAARARTVDDPHDPVARTRDIQFQTDKLAIVTTMVNKVVAKHKLYSGGIPDDIRMKVMGDLIDIYHDSGDVITPEFEQVILNNWVGLEQNESEPETRNIEKVDNKKEEEEEAPRIAETNININVEPGTPVTVNIDGETLQEVDRDNIINVIVHEVDEQEMRAATVIENSQLDGIITPYESSSTDVPLTLPLSAYRCVMGGVSLFDIIKLSSIENGNPRDMDIKTWSLLYKHIKNPSIGDFKTFDDFLKHTDYRDMELLLWGAFVATADETESVHFTCGNPKCRHQMELKYNPRTIIHVSDELVPEHYNMTHQVASGKAAIEHWEKVRSTHKMYELPNSKVLVELDDYSAWDYHNVKMPMMQEIYNRYRPEGGDLNMEALSESESEEMNFLLLFLLYIKSITINKNGKSYKYTNWKDIEKIVTTHIGNKDISILIAVINQTRQTESPISFYLENVKCPKCGREDERIPVNDIMRSLFFQLSSGLNNTTINFVGMDKT